ncbi:hypothetical protein [Streptomyces sp. NPDC020951]|uniref:hypothetical protein n=1 Tax=Streptomyces sp. NPDC020951 TaxID=3365104 RepID=UPI00379129A8
MNAIEGVTSDPGTPGIKGDSTQWNGVLGLSHAAGQAGVAGVNEDSGNGLYGRGTGNGVWGHGFSDANAIGVVGVSDHNDGVRGNASTVGKSGVTGVHDGAQGQGVWGQADNGTGVVGLSKIGAGVYGRSDNGEGIRGESLNPNHGGIVGISSSAGGHGVYGTCDQGTGVIAVAKNGTGLFARAEQGTAGHFAGSVLVEGNIEVRGDLVLPGADYAEELTASAPAICPGTVVVIDDEGRIRPCEQDCDPRVAGIVSGACGVRPALVLDRHEGGAPVALMGKLWALADASAGPIRCGDRLTTSSRSGHARRVTEDERATGAIVGKALTNLESGTGMVRVLVSAG